jgi:hypothetical protein
MEAAEPNRGRKCQQSHGDDMDAMDGQPRTFDGDAATPWVNGSAWAEVDDTFFRIVADVFLPTFCEGASVLLASSDDEADELAQTPADDAPDVIVIPDSRLSHEDALEVLNRAIDRELALRRSMNRHPSRRRF